MISLLELGKFIDRYQDGFLDTKDWPLYRQLISKTARSLSLPLSSMSDPMTGYFALHSNLLEKGKPSGIGFKICLEIYVKCNVKDHGEVGIKFGVRTEGESKLSSKVVVRYLEHLAKLYWYKFPIQITIFLLISIVAAFFMINKLV